MVESTAPAPSAARLTATLTSAFTSHLPSSLQRAAASAVSAAHLPSSLPSVPTGPGVLGNVHTRPSFRVGQLDTELLDEELLDLLKNQLFGALKYFRPSIKENYEPEFMAVLRGVLFKLTIWDNDATYGATLQNLKYVDARGRGRNAARAGDRAPSRNQKILYGLVTVGGRYLYTRLNLWLLARSNPEDETPLSARLSAILEHLQTIHSIATLLSFLMFLKNGHYRTILDRVLRLRLVAPDRTVAREVSFEYLNRQLVWHAFTEFLLFILPVVKVGKWRRWYSRAVRKARALGTQVSTSIGRGEGADGQGDGDGILKTKATGELGFLPEKTCAICFKETSADGTNSAPGGGGGTDITNPYEAVPCGHLYCYICITSKIALEEGDGWECLRCNTLIKKCRPWKGGLWADESGTTARTPEGKKVGFESHEGEEEEVVITPTDDEDDDIPTAVMDTRRGSLADDDDELVKFTETLIEDRQHRRRQKHSARKVSSSSVAVVSASEEEEDDEDDRGVLGESYDHIPSYASYAAAAGSAVVGAGEESESERTERAGSPVLHSWGMGTGAGHGDEDGDVPEGSSATASSLPPLRIHRPDDDDEEEEAVVEGSGSGSGTGSVGGNGVSGSGFLDVAAPQGGQGFNDMGSVYDTAGEEEEEEEGSKTPVWGAGRV